MIRKSFTALMLLALSIVLISCAHNIDKAADSWLQNQTLAPAVDVTGKWNAGSAMGGGWGGGSFFQEGNKIYGTLGFYNVRGVVSGSDLYLNLISRGRVYYTAKLEKKGPGLFRGKAVEGAVIGTEEAKKATIYPIFLEKME